MMLAADGTPRERTLLESVFTLVLVLVVAAILVVLTFLQWNAQIIWVVWPSPLWQLYGEGLYTQYDFFTDYPVLAKHPGVEFACFALGAGIAAAMRVQPGRNVVLRRGKLAPAVPLLSALILLGLIVAVGWVLSRDGGWWIGPTRLGLAALTTAAGYLSAIRHPRVTATLAGAIGGPAIVGILFWAIPPDLLLHFKGHPQLLERVMLTAGAVAGAVLLGAIAARVTRLSPPVLVHAAWSGAVMFFLAASSFAGAWAFTGYCDCPPALDFPFR